jgi:ATP-binding cassette subfamily B multidrug efflux pump
MRRPGMIPLGADERAGDASQVLRRMWFYMKDMRGAIALALLVVMIGAGLTAAGPYLIGRSIDTAIARGDLKLLTILMFSLLVTYLLTYVTNRTQERLLGRIGQRVNRRFRSQIFTTLQRLDLQFFHQHDTGDLMSRLINDVQTLDQSLSPGALSQTIGGLFGLAGISIAMLVLDWRLALATFVVVPLTFGVTTVFGRLARRSFRYTRQTIGDVSANLQEDIAAVRVTQAFNRTGITTERFRELNALNRDANVTAVTVTSAFMPVLDVLGMLAMAIVASFGGYLAIRQPPLVSVGVVVAFLAYVQQFFRPLQTVSTFYAQLQSSLAAAERIFQLVDEKPKVKDAPGARSLDPAVVDGVEATRREGRVEFDHVSFSYLPNEPVLSDVSFVAAGGQTVAVVGPTGGGKSTIVNLLLRFYDVDEGAVLVDGVDVRDVTQESLRAPIALVLQEPFLFSGSIAENIRYGRLDATDEEVEGAARVARADTFIDRLPDGYGHPVGERGGNLSQGQRQLVAFARAVLHDPLILVLDEATASVDTRTEIIIQKALERIMEGRTTLVIAHRLSTVRRADQILVVDEGRIVERGTHKELLAAGGKYADLYRRQFRPQGENKEVDSYQPHRA